VSIEANRPLRKRRANHSIEFKRGLAQRACEPGISVSQLAQDHGINANMLFRWRRQFRAGLLGHADTLPALLPVSVVDDTAHAPSASPIPAQTASAPSSAIEIVFPDCTLRLGNRADPAMLRTVLALLRR
jgi:transposase